MFEHGPDRYGFPDPELSIRDDRTVTLGALLVRPGDRLGYGYHFGDAWEHEVVLPGGRARSSRPTVHRRRGPSPPEDVGGIPGYEDLRRVLAVPEEDGHTQALEWLGIERACEFDASDFSVERANAAIARVLIARPA